MMSQQPDKIFRDKLNNLQRPAPTAAWDRIETNLKKNNGKSGWWWKVAASLLLLATASYILWPAKSTDQPLATTTKQDQTAASELRADANTSVAPSINKKDSGSIKELPKEKVLAATKASAKRKFIQKSVPAEKSTAQTLDNTIAVVQNDEPLDNVEPANEQVTTTPVASTKPKGLKLQFSAEETNKYLDENAVAQATSEGKKSSTFKKLLKKANELKSNQDPFGDLREKKNEILALNFKNEKRGQNK
jgi:hypothetical protein